MKHRFGKLISKIKNLFKRTKTEPKVVNKQTKIAERTTEKLTKNKQFKTFAKEKELSLSDQLILKNVKRVYAKQGKELTEARAMYELNKEKIFSALDNTGYSLQEIADQIGTKVEYIEDINNWEGGIFTDPETGKRYQYHWTYEGTVLEEVA